MTAWNNEAFSPEALARVHAEHLTGDPTIDEQIRHAVDTHGLTPEAAKLVVLAGLDEKQIAAVTQYIKEVPIDLYLLLRFVIPPYKGRSDE